MKYDKYYGNQESPQSLEFSSPANQQYALTKSKDYYFYYLSDDDAFEDDDKEVGAFLSEKLENATIEEFHRCHRKWFPIIYTIARDIMAIPAMSAPAESFFSIVGTVIRKSRNNLSPTTTKMLAVIKNRVTKIRLCDVDSGIESGGTNIDDDPDLCAKIREEIKDDLDLSAQINRNETSLPTIFRIARDYLSMMAMSSPRNPYFLKLRALSRTSETDFNRSQSKC